MCDSEGDRVKIGTFLFVVLIHNRMEQKHLIRAHFQVHALPGAAPNVRLEGDRVEIVPSSLAVLIYVWVPLIYNCVVLISNCK